jgi:hypothetical protein
MIRFAIVVFGIAVIAVAPVAARTYKWVDEHGTTHYSQNKPPDRKAQEMSLKSGWTAGVAPPLDCVSVICRAARLDGDRERLERAAREQRDKAAKAAAARPVSPSHVEETDDEKITRLVAACKKSRGSNCDSDEEKRRMLLQNDELTHAERRALRVLSPARQKRALNWRIPEQYRNIQ